LSAVRSPKEIPMKLRAVLYLAAAFLAAALALTVLPACSDEAGDLACAIECDGCYLISKDADSAADNCYCVDLDSDGTCPLKQ